MPDSDTKLFVKEATEKERTVSDSKYAPYMAWTILLGILGLFGVAIVMKLIAVAGLPTNAI